MFINLLSLFSLAATLSFLVVRQRMLWTLVIFIQGFSALSYSQLGIPLNVVEFATILMASLIWARIISSRQTVSYKALTIFTLSIIAVSVSSFHGFSLVISLDLSMLGFFQQPPIRFAATLVIAFSLFSLLLLPSTLSPDLRNDLPRLFVSILLLATTFQCFVGLYDQLAARSPLPPIPTYGFASADGFHAQRSKGFVGEPRHLAAFVATGLAILVYARLIGHRPKGFLFSGKNLFLHFGVLLLTQSTSGITLTVITLSLLALLSLIRVKAAGKLRVVTTVLFAVPIMAGIATGFFQDFIDQRLGQRLTQETIMRSEFNAAAALEFAAENPLAVLIGTGSGMSPYVLRDTYAFQDFVAVIEQREETIRPPPVLFRTVLEGGVVAVLVKLYILTISIRGLFGRNNDHLNLVSAYMVAHFVFSIVAGNVGAGFLVPGFWIGAGILIYYRIADRRHEISAHKFSASEAPTRMMHN